VRFEVSRAAWCLGIKASAASEKEAVGRPRHSGEQMTSGRCILPMISAIEAQLFSFSHSLKMLPKEGFAMKAWSFP